MSTLYDTNSSDVVYAGASPVADTSSCTILGWVRYVLFTGTPTGEGLFYLNDGTNNNKIDFASASVFQAFAGTSSDLFGTAPSTTGWFAVAHVVNGTGPNSATAYFRNNGDASWTALNTLTGAVFTPTLFAIGQVGKTGISAKFALWKAWNFPMTLAQLNAQFLSATNTHPAGTAGDWPMATAATAGTDISSNGFNLTISGALTDGNDLPTFPPSSFPYPTQHVQTLHYSEDIYD